jgi:hypothetical protein
MKRCLTPRLAKERAGAFSAVTGGRALSFHHLSMGEAAALSLSKGMRRGQNSPVDKWSKKTSPGALGTKEKVPAFSRYGALFKHPLRFLIILKEGIFGIPYLDLSKDLLLDSFHPEMALFPMSVVLRGFPPAAYGCVRLGENPCAA